MEFHALARFDEQGQPAINRFRNMYGDPMQELSIAMGIVDAASDESQRRGVQIRAVHLSLGALSGVVNYIAPAQGLASSTSTAPSPP
jgi:hypothetical protein